MSELQQLITKIREFNATRDWEQFHSPKNLATALVVETAELVEIFQWISEEESSRLSQEKLEHASEEIGDILLYLLNIADKLEIDAIEAAERKLRSNEIKYPVHRSKGCADKYTEFQ